MITVLFPSGEMNTTPGFLHDVDRWNSTKPGLAQPMPAINAHMVVARLIQGEQGLNRIVLPLTSRLATFHDIDK